MKLGFVSAILGMCSLDEVIAIAKNFGYSCVEAACWPEGGGDRRYAGICHIDVDNLDDKKTEEIKQLCQGEGVSISTLAYYPNVLDPDEVKRQMCIGHLKKVMLGAEKLGIGMVATFIGRDQTKTVEENLKLVEEVWTPLMEFAEEHNVKIAIENCPMLFDAKQWPGGQNLMTTPAIWEKIFEIIPSGNLGINFDPSHFIWQMMDYVKPIYKFRDKIFHVHCKDIKLYKDRLNEVGIMDYPLNYMAPKIPGLGDVEWARFISALTDIGYDGNICVEIEDRAFEENKEKILNSLQLSKKYLEQYII